MNLRKLGLFTITSAAVLLTACSDEPANPGTGNGNGNGGGNNTKTCKITETKDSDNATAKYTYDGDNLVRVEENDGGEIRTYDFVYSGGKLTQINEVDTAYKLTYTNDQVTKVEVIKGTEPFENYVLSYNADGTLNEVDDFLIDGQDEELFGRYSYTYTSGELSAILNRIDANEDGVLTDTGDFDIDIQILATDGKKNPYFGLPVYLTDFANFLALSKSNVNAFTVNVFGQPIPGSITYTYNEHDYPLESRIVSGDTVTMDFTYTCE
ncbi:MAG: hypothetical protein JJ975_15040 [Bacteroidia bacterium]|nr:hypothetical protein [Bacteroidia bacterium]